jgi:predicted naringenin-chalcone synthase
MSSPTVVFILQRLLSRPAPLPYLMLAFGPGLMVEAALIE